MSKLTDAQLAVVLDCARNELDFARRVDIVRNVSGRGRAWSRQRAAELWPDAYAKFLATKAPA